MIEETTKERTVTVETNRATDATVRRDHGGDLDAAVLRFGGRLEDWVDLSTGINRRPFPVPAFSPEVFQQLPTHTDIESLIRAAARAYQTRAAILPVAGAQAAIQLVPRLMPAGRVAILAPTYNEYKACFETEGWHVRDVTHLDDLAGADIAVVVNPNNPDGKVHQPEELLAIQRRVSLLVVDESFADATPEVSLAPYAATPGLLVLRSFGKFFGLAGLRLGFALGTKDLTAQLQQMAGPWQVSGPAIEIGRTALADREWQLEMRARLKAEIGRLDVSAANAGWVLSGGTPLFRLYRTGNAVAAQAQLARHQIWSRIFPWSAEFVRLGLPGNDAEWTRLEVALSE